MRAAPPDGDLAEVLSSSRAELHRYCARLTGSIFDGEDVVQDVMVRALAADADRPADTPIRAWLFRIAHNRALDVLRTRATRARLLPVATEEDAVTIDDPFEAAAMRQAAALAIGRFVELPPLQRSVVILRDVLEETNEDVASMLDLTLQSVKAHLHRGRARIRELAAEPAAPEPRRTPRPETQRYVELFNARDWPALRQLLSSDVRLVQMAKGVTVGREEVSSRFFAGYDASKDWHLRCASVEGREVAWVAAGPDGADYPMAIEWRDGEIAAITDYRYARHVASEIAPMMQW